MMRRAGTLGALALALVACTEPTQRTITPEGRLDVLAPSPAFTNPSIASDWVVGGETDFAKRFIKVVTRDGLPALEVRPQAATFQAVRRVNAWLAPTPYLSWSWHMNDHGTGLHPVRIIVGFRGGKPVREDDKPWYDFMLPKADEKDPLPLHDRVMEIAWSDTLLNRGRLLMGTQDTPPIYVARGGRENARSWWVENADLLRLYTKAFPGDDTRQTKVVFIGVISHPGANTVGRISTLQLKR